MKTLLDQLSEQKTDTPTKEHLLRLELPVVYCNMMKTLGRTQELRSDHENFTWFIMHHLLPMLDELRTQGKLQTIKKKMMYDQKEWDYEGEANEANQAHGKGTLTAGRVKIEATFINDQIEGIAIQDRGIVLKRVQEFKEGSAFGKQTTYIRSNQLVVANGQTVINMMMSDGNKSVGIKQMTQEPWGAFYAIDGTVMKAMDRDWKNYLTFTN